MLIDEIIQILSNPNGSLSEALLKTKVLLHQLGKKELIGWINSEMNGYSDGGEVPPYRILPSEVMGQLTSINMQASSHPIPIGHLKKEQQKNLTSSKMVEPIAVIEDFGRNDESKLIRRLPMEWNNLLAKSLTQGIYINSAWCEINYAAAINILVQVRSRLLDFLLELKDSLGEVTSETDLKKQASSIDAEGMFRNAFFDKGATIIINQGIQTFNNISIKGNLEELTKILSGNGIPQNELENLRKAITADRKNDVQKPFEGETGKWYTKILNIAAEGGLKVGVDIVATGVAKAIAAYYGFPS